jgi:hypothetical protein
MSDLYVGRILAHGYQVLRRTYSTLIRRAGVDPKVVADSMGHDLDVNLNSYTQTSLDSHRRRRPGIFGRRSNARLME